MKRTIKVRAWHEDNKSFVYSELRGIWKNGFRCSEAYEDGAPLLIKKNGIYATENYFEQYCGAFELNADWEQYTGLKDKSGKEIYFNSDKVKGVDCQGCEYTGYIDNSDPYCTMLIWETKDGGDSIPIHIFAYSEPFEIIGNIHDQVKSNA